MSSFAAWVAVGLTITLTVYGQVTLKARVLRLRPGGRIHRLIRMYLDPWVLSALAASVLAAVSWIAAMTKLPLSLAYPFTAMGFVLVTVLGSLIFRERLNSKRLAGIVLVACGLMLIALSSS